MKKDKLVLDALVMVFQFGINMIVPIGLCVMIGVWIGNQTGADWVTIPFFFVGAIAGGTNIYKFAKKMVRDAGREKKEKGMKRSSRWRMEHAQKNQ